MKMKLKPIVLSLLISTSAIAETNSISLSENGSSLKQQLTEQVELGNQSNKKNEIEVEKKLTRTERIKIILDEKKRLKEVGSRRFDDPEITLGKSYIRNTLYSSHVKGLMREASFYMNFLINNSTDKEAIKKESKNISWNAICLSKILKKDTSVVFNILQLTNFDEGSVEEQKFKSANNLLLEIFAEGNILSQSKEEADIRCHEVYNNSNVNAKD